MASPARAAKPNRLWLPYAAQPPLLPFFLPPPPPPPPPEEPDQVTELSVLVDAALVKPVNAPVAAPAEMLATTVPAVVMPVTLTV